MKWINFVLALVVVGVFDWLVLQGVIFSVKKIKRFAERARSGG